IKSVIPKDKIENVEKEGVIIIQSKYLLDIIKKMPSEVINFEVVDDLKIIIFADNSEYNLNCLNSLDYPEIQLEDNKSHIDIKSNELKKMISQTIFAVSQSRPLLDGINIKVNGDVLECVATDSYRLAKKVINLPTPYEEMVNIIIPGRTIGELDKILVDNEDNVEMHIFPKKIMFKFNNIIFQTNLLNGEYPNTSSFIPTEFAHVVTANLNELFGSIDRAALLTQSKEKNIVKMELNENQLILSSFASEIGKVEDKITVKRNINEPMAISFSSKYMMDALKTFDSEEILINMNSDSKPIILKVPNDDSLIQLILPIKTY
ncbi:MAG: DNA polymerase III subunit beta, partial [Bacilli bacterium]|nr:DNA polymerase III subunit beta [Bacilli bacterium]